MTAEPTSAPPPDDEDVPVVTPPGSTPEPTQEELDRFPLLAGVMETYFTRPNGNIDFLTAYEVRGEASVEFDGLAAEMKDAVRNPRPATRVINHVLPGLDLTHGTVRQQMIELLDQMQGIAPDETTTDEEPEALSVDALYDEWLFRRVRVLPIGKFADREFPLWQIFLAGLVVLLIGTGLGVFIPWPGFLIWIPTMIRTIGGVALAGSAVAMLIFRSNARRPERVAEREQERKAAMAKVRTKTKAVTKPKKDAPDAPEDPKAEAQAEAKVEEGLSKKEAKQRRRARRREQIGDLFS